MTKVKFNKDVIFFSGTKQEKKYGKGQIVELSELPVKNFGNYAEIVKESTEKKSDKPLVEESTDKKSDKPLVKESTEKKSDKPLVEESTEKKSDKPLVEESTDKKSK